MASINGDLSDLFFNHTHDRRNALYAIDPNKRRWTDDDERAAVTEDAHEFIKMVRPIVFDSVLDGVTPDALADDFMRRC